MNINETICFAKLKNHLRWLFNLQATALWLTALHVVCGSKAKKESSFIDKNDNIL